MKKLILFLLPLFILTACVEEEQYDNTTLGNFQALWKIMNEHYCFFEEKGVDWDSTYSVYSPRIVDKMTRYELFKVCSEMLNELRDGHTNLIAPFNVSYYHQW